MINNPSCALLSNIAANTVGAAFTWPGGAGLLACVATAWGGGAITFQFLGPDGATWLNYTGISLTANGYATFSLPQGSIRATLAGATSASGVYATASMVPVGIV